MCSVCSSGARKTSFSVSSFPRSSFFLAVYLKWIQSCVFLHLLVGTAFGYSPSSEGSASWAGPFGGFSYRNGNVSLLADCPHLHFHCAIRLIASLTTHKLSECLNVCVCTALSEKVSTVQLPSLLSSSSRLYFTEHWSLLQLLLFLKSPKKRKVLSLFSLSIPFFAPFSQIGLINWEVIWWNLWRPCLDAFHWWSLFFSSSSVPVSQAISRMFG